MTLTSLLVADCVSKSYGARRVLSSATLRADEGLLRVLFGRNGVGKSTLMGIAAGQIRPDGGIIHFDGQALLSTHQTELAEQGLFYLSDRGVFSARYSIRTQLEMLRSQYRASPIQSAVERLRLGSFLDSKPPRLSGGELRRAEFAAALVRAPRCLLADEPLRGVSPKDAEELLTILRELAIGGTAVVVSGHDVSSLLTAADRVTWCTSGTTYELGSPDQACRNETFRREYLGVWSTFHKSK